MTEKIISYKGFDKDLKCRGFQYEIGKTYEHDGEVRACESGFHACENPLDVFGYYPPALNRFAIVEQDGELSRHGDDSKVASKSISIKAEIGIAGIAKAAIDYTISKCLPVDKKSPAFNDQERSHASNTGDYSAASNTGYQSAASVSGRQSVAIATGYQSKAMASKDSALVLVYRNSDYEIVHIKASKVGENGIKPDTWYRLDESGDFIEVDE